MELVIKTFPEMFSFGIIHYGLLQGETKQVTFAKIRVFLLQDVPQSACKLCMWKTTRSVLKKSLVSFL